MGRRRGLGLRVAIAFGAAALTVLPALGQDSPSSAPSVAASAARSKVGLVLSGGGARGGAHIGVLKALEELRVPVDYIAGTSIGAIIGGFYVSGMSVAELEELVESLEWNSAFLNVTPRQLKSFRRKRDDDLFLVDQKPGLNDGEFELPVGLVQGQVIDTIISRVTLRASQASNFDELAIPFRAVAGDLATGEPVVLSSGSLAKAIRASMSIPAVLSPIEIDGRLLVDGGIAMNLPVEVAQDMGAETIIAVDISSSLLTRESMRSVVDVTTQLTNLLTRTGTVQQRDKLGPQDILVAPQFSEDLGSVSFARMDEAIQTGYDAVMARRSEFERLSLPDAAYEAHIAARRDPRMRELPVIDFVRLDNDAPIDDAVIEARLGAIELGEPLDVDAVEQAMNTVYGLEYYQNVRYGLVDEGDRTGIELELDRRSWGPHYLQLGMTYSTAADSDALFGLAASYLSTAVNPRGGEWRATLVVGDEPAFRTDRYQPFGERGLHSCARPPPRSRSAASCRRGANIASACGRRVAGSICAWAILLTYRRMISGAASSSAGSASIRSTGSRFRARARSRSSNGGPRACDRCKPTQISISSSSPERTRAPGAGTRCSRRCVTTPPSAATQRRAACCGWVVSSTSRV
jgi:NTE family protein